MTNLEKYMDEILKNVGKMQLKCVLLELRNGVCYRFDDRYEGNSCTECSIDSIKWLAEEYKPKIKLKQWEYDLIERNITQLHEGQNIRFESCKLFTYMKDKGHFKGIDDVEMTLKEILKNAEVEDDE